MRADDKIYDLEDDDKQPLFQCCLENQPATKLSKKLGPCRTDVLFVCSGDERCTYAFCNSCLDPGFVEEKSIDYFTSFINLKRNPTALVSLVAAAVPGNLRQTGSGWPACAPNQKQYSGYFDINVTTSKHYFYCGKYTK